MIFILESLYLYFTSKNIKMRRRQTLQVNMTIYIKLILVITSISSQKIGLYFHIRLDYIIFLFLGIHHFDLRDSHPP